MTQTTPLPIDEMVIKAYTLVVVPKPSKLSVHCPECTAVLDPKFIASAAARLRRAAKDDSKARPRVIKKCPYCPLELSTSEWRFHKARCPSRPKNLRGRKPNPRTSKKEFLRSLSHNPNVVVQRGVPKPLSESPEQKK